MNAKFQSYLWLLGGVGVFVLFIIFQIIGVQAFVGDIDVSGEVDDLDLAIIDAAYGSKNTSTNWDARADINLDNYVNLKDLALAGRSYGDTFNFYSPRRVSNGRYNNSLATTTDRCNAAVDHMGRVHVIWEEYPSSTTYLFYTQLDASGNALIEDVLIDKGDYVGGSRLAVGPDGSAHIIYHGPSSLIYNRLNTDGSFIDSGMMIDDVFTIKDPAIAVDEFNHAHIAYTKTSKKAMYTIIGENGLLLPATQLNPGSTDMVGPFAVAISPDGARHILWHQYKVGNDELRYTRISKDGLVTINNEPIAILQGDYKRNELFIAADSENAVHFMYYDFRDDLPGIYWSRANSDGSFSAEKLISNNVYSGGGKIAYTIDTSDNIHFVAYWESAYGHTGYGRLDRDGNIIIAFQRVVFDTKNNGAVVTVDPTGRVMIVSPSRPYQSPLVIFSTVPDLDAYDLNRADLVLDKAHLTVTKYLLKITESAEINLQITNGGPAQADGVEIRYSYPDVGNTTSHIDVHVGDIPAFTYVDLYQTIPVPDFEEVDAWEVTVTVSTSTPETTLVNNSVVVPFGVFPPPRQFNLEILSYDETFSGGDPLNAEPLVGAALTVNCEEAGYSQTIESTELFNIFWDIPLNTDPSNAPLYRTYCDVTLSKPGFSTSSVEVYAQRLSEANPYEVLLSTRPINLYINTWGEIEGVVKDQGGEPIQNALVKLAYGTEVNTGIDGSFFFEKIRAGDHTLQVWAEGFEPIQNHPLAVTQGKKSVANFSMKETQRADVFGVAVNEYNVPVPGAVVKFFEGSTEKGRKTTGNDGAFSFSVDPYQNGSTYRLVTTHQHYNDSTVTLSLKPGLPQEHDVILQSKTGSGDRSTGGSITSWVQDERWCKAYGHDEDLPLKTKILQKIGSKWCPSFQTVVNWGAFDYQLGLNFTEDNTGKTITELLIRFTNKDFMSYDVSGGGWHSGGESLSVTAQRIDWIELIAIDSNGNPVGTYVWHDSQTRYSSLQDDPVRPSWRFQINTLAPNWDQVAIRIFYTIGQYDASKENKFKTWHPPADLGLVGSGSPSGADRQVITWMLKNNHSSMRYSLADYKSFLNQNTGTAEYILTTTDSHPMWQVNLEENRAVGNLSIVPVNQGAPQIGKPYAVDITISGFETSPVYALQFDLDFDENYLQLTAIQTVPDFDGPYGSWHRHFELEDVNQAGKLIQAAVVRLAAPTGLTDGSVIRYVFMPVKVTPPDKTIQLKLTGTIQLAGIESNLFSPESIQDVDVPVIPAMNYLPLLLK